MSSDLLVALSGGAIGATLTAVIGQAGRASVAWGEVSLHDNEALDRNRRLKIWVDDRTRQLVQDMNRITNEFSSKGQLYSGAHGSAAAGAKSAALHQYRDEAEKASIDLAQLRAKEGAWHSFWRLLCRRPAPDLTVTAEVGPFLDRWREPVLRHGEANPIVPLDRTRRTFQDAVAELHSLKLN